MALEIIAELAQGYEGDRSKALMLTKAAVKAKADSAKMQIIYADELAQPDYKYYGLFKQLEMPQEVWNEVTKLAHEGGLKMYFDVFGDKSFEIAQKAGADGVKVHSTDFFNTRLIQKCVDTFSKVFVSFGGIHAEELQALSKRVQFRKHKPTFMFGFQSEPTPIAINNLNRLNVLKQMFSEFDFGFMDHSDGAAPEAQTLAAVALGFGVTTIEKHLSLDRELELEDYVSALTPSEFIKFAASMRSLETALGTSSLSLTDKEVDYRQRAIKVAVAKQDLPIGTLIREEHVNLTRVDKRMPEAMVSLDALLGKKLKSELKRNAQFTPDALG